MSTDKKDSKPDETKPVLTTEKKDEITKQEPELPKFEKNMADKITKKFGERTEIAFVKPTRIRVNVKKEDIKDVAKFIRDDLNFEQVESVSGVDYPEDNEIEVVYHIGSYTNPKLSKQILTLATRAPREDNPNPGNDSTRLPSLRDIFYSVEFHEPRLSGNSASGR